MCIGFKQQNRVTVKPTKVKLNYLLFLLRRNHTLRHEVTVMFGFVQQTTE